MSSGLMDTAPGGETPQYESINTVTKPHSKQSGQTGEAETQADAVDSQQDQEKAEKGARTAENVRYGQGISEGGMGGTTTEGQGEANQGGLLGMIRDADDASVDTGYGGTENQTSSGGEPETAESRREQGYGPGSGVGA
ncbi:MAG: hypothetical protein Q9191_005309 [Dirinaria sp. TL-2023a]